MKENLFILRLTLALCLMSAWRVCGGEPIVRMLVPGFTVQELPLKISNINNLRFSPDGTLTALGYDGRIHLLRDTDGDGLEDSDVLFWEKPTITVPVGMCWSPEGLYVSSHGKISLLRDENGDGQADSEEIIASGWPPTETKSGGVDATSITRDVDGNLFFGLLTANYANPYQVKDGVSHYTTNSLRGTIQKWSPNAKKLETFATGIRVPYTLAFNKAGDLFVTDQEGETWCPNGNPLDELNHIVPGKNYGFPPRHEKWLPDLVSEPPVVAFGPQHQSTCGFDFNEPLAKNKNFAGRGLFGPKFWEGNALVAGQSRGKIWRVSLEKTSGRYTGESVLIARLTMLTADVAISPQGDLYVSCHSGKPDWGTGPRGEGKIFKISYTDKIAPQPMKIQVVNQTEVRVLFDRAIDASVKQNLSESKIEFGDYVSAADRFEVLKPPYKSVKIQDQTPRRKLKIISAQLDGDQKTLVLTTAAHPLAAKYALTLTGLKAKGAASDGVTVDLDYDLSGANGSPRPSWLPAVAHKSIVPEENPELVGGDFQHGKNLFFGDQLKCATCHRIRGEGKMVAPDLSNLVSRDVGSILRDIKEPSATINPDYVAFNVSLKDGEDLSGYVRAQNDLSLSILGLDGKETTIDRSNLNELRASAVSMMPGGLIDGLKEGQIKDLLTFLTSEPPQRTHEEVEQIIALTQPEVSPEQKSAPRAGQISKIVWVAGKQDHGPGEHDYPAVEKMWLSLLTKVPGISVTNAWEWPGEKQLAEANVLVFYFWNRDWNEARLAQLDGFLARGGGVVMLHSASISKDPERLAESIGLAAQSGRTKYLHMPLDLKITGTNAITKNFPNQIHFLDEPYWPLIGDRNKITVLGTVKLDKLDEPQLWTFEKGEGRVFGSIIGHYTWTHQDPVYQGLVIRGIGWAARNPYLRLAR